MSARKLCQSCAGPRPRAAVRCPWCLASYTSPARVPEHLFGTAEGEKGMAPGTYQPAARSRR